MLQGCCTQRTSHCCDFIFNLYQHKAPDTMTKAAFILWTSLTLCQVTPSRKRPENSSTSGGLAGWTFKVRFQLCRVTRMRSPGQSTKIHLEEEKTAAKCDPLLKTLAFQLVAMALFWLSLPRFSKPHNLGP